MLSLVTGLVLILDRAGWSTRSSRRISVRLPVGMRGQPAPGKEALIILNGPTIITKGRLALVQVLAVAVISWIIAVDKHLGADFLDNAWGFSRQLSMALVEVLRPVAFRLVKRLVAESFTLPPPLIPSPVGPVGAATGWVLLTGNFAHPVVGDAELAESPLVVLIQIRRGRISLSMEGSTAVGAQAAGLP